MSHANAALTPVAHHSDARTTQPYDRPRINLDRHGVHFLTSCVGGASTVGAADYDPSGATTGGSVRVVGPVRACVSDVAVVAATPLPP